MVLALSPIGDISEHAINTPSSFPSPYLQYGCGWPWDQQKEDMSKRGMTNNQYKLPSKQFLKNPTHSL